MNTMKRLTSLLLAVCMLVAILPAGMFTASAAVGTAYVYDFAEAARVQSQNQHKGAKIELLTMNDFNSHATYSGTTAGATWRFAREHTTAKLVQHNGTAATDTIPHGIFCFSGDSTDQGHHVTFEIYLPEDGKYNIGIDYYDYGNTRDVDVYLSEKTSSPSIGTDACKLVSIIPSRSLGKETTALANNINLAKGYYYVTVKTSKAGNGTDQRYFTWHGITFNKVAENSVSAYKVAIERSNHDILAVGETVQLTAKVWPRNLSEGYASQTVDWASSNTNIATVDANGLVTAKKEGTVCITGTSKIGGSVETVSIVVGDSKSLLYAVNDDIKKYMEKNYGSTTEINLKTDTASAFKDTYQHVTSDKWCYTSAVDNRDVTAYLGNHRKDGNGVFTLNSKFGAFLQYDTTGNAVTFKINVPEDGNYIPEFGYYGTPTSKKADVYIYPVSMASSKQPLTMEEFKVHTLSTYNNALVRSGNNVAIPLHKGEYYVTFNNNDTSGSGYVYLHYIALLYKGAYNNTTVVDKIDLTNNSPKVALNSPKHHQITAKVYPLNADQQVTWSSVESQTKFVSVDANGWVTGDKDDKGSNVISATVGGVEEVTSVANCELLYAFSNVGKDYVMANGGTSVIYDVFNDYSKITSADKWSFVEATTPNKPVVYHGYKDGSTSLDKYGMFINFTGGVEGEYVRFKINIPETGNYKPEVMYRDYGTDNVRLTDIYLAPVNAVNPFDTRILRIFPYSGNKGADRGIAVQDGADFYLPAGDYYLSFRPTPTTDPDAGKLVNTLARYLPLYHLALIKQDTTVPIAPKAVVITKPHTDPLAVGETLKLSARVVPTWASQVVDWKSYNTDVATVDKNGVVTAKKNGIAVITATTRNDARSETVVIQVGTDTQVYAFNEVLKKYMENNNFDNATKKNMITVANESDFTDVNYSWQDTYKVGQSWRWLGGSETASAAYTGDSKKHDTGTDDSDANFKYGLFLMSNSIDSYAHFEIQVDEPGQYTAEVFQYMAKNNTDTKQSSRAVKVYISPIGTASVDLTDDCYYVGTTVLKNGSQQSDGSYWSYGLDSQHFNADGDNRIQLTAGKYNLIFKAADGIGRYLYLHHFALYKEAEYTQPDPTKVMITKTGSTAGEKVVADEVFYLDASKPSVNLTAQVFPSAADQTLTWSTSDASIATVNRGFVTVNSSAKEGTAIITATTANGVTDTVRIIVGNAGTFAQQYDFLSSTRNAFESQVNDKTTVRLFGTNFHNNYEGSQTPGADPNAVISSPWMLLGTNDPTPYCDYTNSSSSYGLFIMSSTDVGTYTQFKIKVKEDANYAVVFNIRDWTCSNDFDVYLAPAKAEDPMDARWYVGDHKMTGRDVGYYALDLGERTLYAGEYILTVKSTKVNYFGSNGGLVAIKNLSIFRTGDAFYTFEGAQIRTTGVQGLRFISTISKNEFNVDSREIAEFGTLLLPASMLKDQNGKVDGSKLTEKTANRAIVPAKNRYIDNADYVSFTAVLTGLTTKAHYEMDVVARAYVKLADGTYIYGDTWTMRSLYDVAKNGWDNYFDDLKVAERKAFAEIINKVEGTNYVVDDNGNVTGK